MGILSFIADRGSKLTTSVQKVDKYNSLIVATQDLKTYIPKIVKFFENPTYGTQLNQNIAFGGTPEEIHDGTDNTYWTASTIFGTWDFASTDQAYTGTKSIDGTETKQNHTAQFAKGSNITVANYTAITGWIYIDDIPKPNLAKINIYGWDTGTSTQQGIAIDILNYVDKGVNDTWQKFSIPLQSMNLVTGTIDAIRIQVIDDPNYYLDDIQIEETGIPQEYKLEPSINTWLFIDNINLFFVDAYAGTLADATMPNLAYNQILGVTQLTNGIIVKYVEDGITSYSYTPKNLFELQLMSFHIIDLYSDGTNTALKLSMTLRNPIILHYEHEDYLSLTISDNLSGLIDFRATCNCREEIR